MWPLTRLSFPSLSVLIVTVGSQRQTQCPSSRTPTRCSTTRTLNQLETEALFWVPENKTEAYGFPVISGGLVFPWPRNRQQWEVRKPSQCRQQMSFRSDTANVFNLHNRSSQYGLKRGRRGEKRKEGKKKKGREGKEWNGKERKRKKERKGEIWLPRAFPAFSLSKHVGRRLLC